MSDSARPLAPDRPTVPHDYGIPQTVEGTLAWDHVRERMTQARNYWIATARADGLPHAVPVWGVWVDDTLYFGGSPTMGRVDLSGASSIKRR